MRAQPLSFSMFRHRWSLLVVGLAMVGLVVALTSLRTVAGAESTPPYPPPPQCALSSTQSGNQVTLVGSGFPHNTFVALSAHSTATSLGGVRTDSNGSFTTTITVPSSLEAGVHQLEASIGPQKCTTNFTTTTTTPPPPTSTKPPTPLAFTGFQAVTATGIAVALLAGGVLLVVLGRRRSRAHR